MPPIKRFFIYWIKLNIRFLSISGCGLITPIFDEISKLSNTGFILEEGLSQTVQNVIQLTLNYNFYYY